MFHKYHVPTQEAPARFTEPVKSGIIDWTSGCIGCLTCVKKACPMGSYDLRQVDPVTLQDAMDSVCQDCFRCVQSCPQRLIQKTINPEWAALGDDYYSPPIISATWAQAATGKIPVSGAGYGGTFTGPGFDAMWTDMSEIVRPTRDGIHGREYISTAIQLGRRHLHLAFDDHGELTTPTPPMRELQLPILFQLPPDLAWGESVRAGLAQAAQILDTALLVPAGAESGPNLIPIFDGPTDSPGPLAWLTGPAAEPEAAAELIAAHPQSILGFGHALNPEAEQWAVDMVRAGAGLLHLTADPHGQAGDGSFIKDAVRRVHLALVEQTLRDQVTILVSGGVAMAEHLAKAIICGADGVVLDWPLLIALECRYCDHCHPETCPIMINRVEPDWAAQRVVNLMGAWRDQLLEVMGAMGLREVRRLRGEVGRAMFYQDLEAEVFEPLFGQKSGEVLS